MRVIVADDAVLFREGVASLLLRAGFDVVGTVGDMAGLDRLLTEQTVSVVILDIRMPPSHTNEGLVAAKRIRGQYPEVGVVLLSQHVETHHALDLLNQSAVRIGYLLKDRVAEVSDFIDAVRRVGQGGTVIDPVVVSNLIGRRRSTNLVDELTPRERSVLALMAEGRSNDSIVSTLKISSKTLEAHVGSIYSKLQLEQSGQDHRRVLAVLNYLQTL